MSLKFLVYSSFDTVLIKLISFEFLLLLNADILLVVIFFSTSIKSVSGKQSGLFFLVLKFSILFL